MTSTEQQLEQLNKAISEIENGAQEYQIGSRRVSKANIFNLYRERERLENKVSQEQNNSVFVARFDRR